MDRAANKRYNDLLLCWFGPDQNMKRIGIKGVTPQSFSPNPHKLLQGLGHAENASLKAPEAQSSKPELQPRGGNPQP